MRKKKSFKKDIASIKQELLEIKNMVEMKNLKAALENKVSEISRR